MLRSIGLFTDQGLTYASLILFGKKEKIDHLLPCAEIILEWRQTPGKIAHDFRKNLREKQPVANPAYEKKFLESGMIEPIGKTKGRKYILSHRHYTLEGTPGIHTRLAGLSRDQRKELIVNHLRKNKKGGMADFLDAFGDLLCVTYRHGY